MHTPWSARLALPLVNLPIHSKVLCLCSLRAELLPLSKNSVPGTWAEAAFGATLTHLQLALIKVRLKVCPVSLGLEARLCIDILTREGSLMNAGDCG